MDKTHFNQGLLAYLDASPTPFHAVAVTVDALRAAGYVALEETASWPVPLRGRFYVTRNDSSLIAFELDGQPPAESGFCLVGAHTDSPCLRLKPAPELRSHGYWQLGVEVYGGALLNPWFDRELGLAGRITLESGDGQRCSRLLHLAEPLAIIPSLAIHLDREVNDKRSINRQQHLPALIARASGVDFDLRQVLHERLAAAEPALHSARILDFELSFCDLQPSAFVGWRQEFIAAPRLDNLLSCYTALSALLAAGGPGQRLIVLNDHEEVGSGSTAGARGNFLRSVLERLTGGGEALARSMARSILVSTDNAHGVHPNYADRHDPNHSPLLNEGPVLKVNHNQSYATNSETAGWFRTACRQAGVPLQQFVTRSDLGCGSTIGPLTAAGLGVPTVDVGVPTFAMHSIRELAGRDDAWSLREALRAAFSLTR